MKLGEDDPRAEVWNRFYGTLQYNLEYKYSRWTATIRDRKHATTPDGRFVTSTSGNYRWTMRFWLWRNLRAVRNNALRANDYGLETFD